MDKEQKRRLKREWQSEQRTKRLAQLPLDVDELRELVVHLEDAVPQFGCDRTLRLAQAWLESRGRSVEQVNVWLRSNGMYCDCEVVLNLDSTLGS